MGPSMCCLPHRRSPALCSVLLGCFALFWPTKGARSETQSPGLGRVEVRGMCVETGRTPPVFCHPHIRSQLALVLTPPALWGEGPALQLGPLLLGSRNSAPFQGGKAAQAFSAHGHPWTDPALLRGTGAAREATEESWASRPEPGALAEDFWDLFPGPRCNLVK